MASQFSSRKAQIAMAAMAFAGLVAWAYVRFRSPPESSATRSDTGERVRVEEEIGAGVRPITLRFWDQSEILLLPSSRIKVMELRREATRVSVLHGRIEARIGSGLAGRWRIDVGPYWLHVEDTEFDLAWNSDRTSMTIHTHEGVVHVWGGGLVAHRLVYAGRTNHFDGVDDMKPRPHFTRATGD